VHSLSLRICRFHSVSLVMLLVPSLSRLRQGTGSPAYPSIALFEREKPTANHGSTDDDIHSICPGAE